MIFKKHQEFENKKDKIELIQPKPYGEVGLSFTISGKVPKSWLRNNRHGLDISLMYDNGREFLNESPQIIWNIFSNFKKKIEFSCPINLCSYGNAKRAYYGLIVEITGDNKQSFLFPLLIKVSDTITEQKNEKEKLKKVLLNSINKIIRNRGDWEKYRSELSKIYKSKIGEKEILEGIFEILDKSEVSFEPFSKSDEDEQEEKLKEKYKEAINQHGPLLGGAVGRMAGFDFCVYSDDHDQHFHVVHRGRGIDARFSFPEIQLINYKNIRAKLGSKEQKKIQDFLKNPLIFQKLENEFSKRKIAE